MTIPALAGWLLFALPAIPTGVFLIEMLAGLAPARRTVAPLPAISGRIVVLIPAHDEESGIAGMLDALRAVLPANAKALVVADNCTDATAAIARRHGASVIERDDPVRRGKGYALAFGRDHLAADPTSPVPEYVIVLDADCRIEAGAIERLAGAAIAHGTPVQACYLMVPRIEAAPMVQISSFAFLVRNLIRQTGLGRIGAPALLTGTGMAFPWKVFAQAPLATGDLVEDLALGVDLLRAGLAPRFEPAARVWSEPAGEHGTRSQRTRWEQGFLAIARCRGLPLIGDGLRCRRWALLWAGLDLLIPPLALLAGLLGAVTLLTIALAIAGMPRAPLIGVLLVDGAFSAVLFAAWALHGRAHVTGRTLLQLPIYIVWKVPIYAKLLFGRGETRWIRTDREG